MANPMGKTRKVEEPYLVYESLTGFEWRVLKAYSTDPNKRAARWFLATKSPYTGGSYELGDGYIADVVKGSGLTAGRLTFRDPVVPDEAIPDPKLVAASPMEDW